MSERRNDILTGDLSAAQTRIKGEASPGFNEPEPHTPRYPRALCPLNNCTCTGEWTCDPASLAMVTR